jgi:hypothetical protein
MAVGHNGSSVTETTTATSRAPYTTKSQGVRHAVDCGVCGRIDAGSTRVIPEKSELHSPRSAWRAGVSQNRDIPVSFVFGVSPWSRATSSRLRTPVKDCISRRSRIAKWISAALIPDSKGEGAIMMSCERLRKFPSAKSFRSTRRHQRFREESFE